MMRLTSRVFEVADMAAAIDFCYEKKWTDGLPVIPPTTDAVRRIIDHLKRDPSDIVGVIPPRDGLATIESIAINCVMAGCQPEYAPIVIAIVEAMLVDRFNLNGVQTTTHGGAPLAVVSGPAVKKLGFNTKEGTFGHGCRPSATIGRAVRLILWNIGGGYPGEPCKTTHGHPGYYSFCIAEDQDMNPWEPLQVERGYRADDTIVTVTAVEAPRSIGCGAGYSPIEDVLFCIADSIAVVGCQAVTGGDMVLVLSPMAAQSLAAAGLTKWGVKLELMRLATRPVRDMKRRRALSATHPAHWSKIADENDDHAEIPFIRDVENLIILVAGGWGSGSAFCSLCTGWGVHGGFATSKRVEFPNAGIPNTGEI